MRRSGTSIRIILGTSIMVASLIAHSVVVSSGCSQVELGKNENVSFQSERIAAEEDALPEIIICDLVPLEERLQKKAQEFCGDYGVPYEIVLAVIHQESRFDENSYNGNCVGLMQINRINSEWLKLEIGVTDLSDSEQNLHAGIWMLGNLFEKYGEWNMVLTAYNNGESGAKKKFFDKGKISCQYSEEILRNCEEWKIILEESHE